ncbi:MAG TPA: DUF2460 domain-containing protein [Thermohalobaculum sp.]|nr:DUF2460 domain-containing protein [Thermohalobaculum sp.]
MAFHERRLPDKYSRGAVGGMGFSTQVVETAGGHEQRNIDFAQDRAVYDISHLIKTPADLAVLKAFHAARRGRAHGFRHKDWNDFQATRTFIGLGDGAATSFQLVKTYADVVAGTAQAGAAASITLAAAQADWPDHGVDDTYNGTTIRIAAGTGVGQVRRITDYVGATKVATVAPAFVTAPDATSTYEIELFTYMKDIVKPVEGTVTVYLDDAAAAPASLDLKTGIFTLSPAPASGAVITADFEFDLPVRFDVDVQRIEFASIAARSWSGLRLIEVKDF